MTPRIVLTIVTTRFYYPAMPTTGKQLRRLRRASELTTVAVAARMGVSRQTLWGIERAAEVSPERAEQYRAAVRDATMASEPTAAA